MSRIDEEMDRDDWEFRVWASIDRLKKDMYPVMVYSAQKCGGLEEAEAGFRAILQGLIGDGAKKYKMEVLIKETELGRELTDDEHMSLGMEFGRRLRREVADQMNCDNG